MIAQEVWQVHDQVLLMILRKEFIKLNVNMDIILKNVELAELNTKIASAALITQTL